MSCRFHTRKVNRTLIFGGESARILGVRRGCGLSLLGVILTLLLSSCQKQDGESHDAESMSIRPPDATPVNRTPSTANDAVNFSMGATKFVAPTEVVGFQVAYQGQEVDFVTLEVFFPYFVGLSQSSVKVRSHLVQISLDRRQTGLPSELPSTKEEAEELFARRYPETKYVQAVNEELGLIEIKYRDSRDYVAYRRIDGYVRPTDNTVPVTVCLGKQPVLCDGIGYLSPDIIIRYRFDIGQLSSWKSIDNGVFNIIGDFRQEEK